MTIKLNSGYQIVIPAAANVSGEYAAAELAKYLEKIVGVVFPVVKDDAPVQDKEILIGKTNRFGTPNGAGLKNDGYILRTMGEKLFIYGENDHANLYGVYYLLEKYLGCGFYSLEVEKVPENAEATLPEMDDKRVSPFEFREARWVEPGRNCEFAVKLGLNASRYITYDKKVGGDICVDSLAHTMFRYIHPDEYFDEHPEYFSMVNGVRIREETQLCLTNPEVLAIFKKKLRQKIKDEPEGKIFGISQMDWYNPCQCPECARIDAEEGSHMGTMMRFLNALAEDIEKDYPDVLIETLAYQYTRHAPKLTKPHPNIVVCLCTIECCFTHPLRSCNHIAVPFKYLSEPSVTVQQDLREWGKICKRMMIWDYTTNYRFFVAPNINFHVLQDNVNFFLENGVALLHEQGNGLARSGEFGELRAWLLGKLMWEPKGDMSAWMDQFLEGYYGEGAAPHIRGYIDYLSDFVVKYDVHAGIYESPQDVIPDAILPDLEAFWDAAEAATEDKDQLKRIRRSRLQLEFVKVHRKRRGDADFMEVAEAFIEKVKEHEVTMIQEGKPLEWSFDQIRTGNLPDSWRVFWGPQPVDELEKKY